MFSIFFKKTKNLGIYLKGDTVYYSVTSSDKKPKIIYIGEEKIARVEPKNGLLSSLTRVLEKTKIAKANICFSNDVVRVENILILKSKDEDVNDSLRMSLSQKRLISFNEDIFYFEKIESFNNQEHYKVFVTSKENIAFFVSVFTNSGISINKLVDKKDAILNFCLPFDNTKNILFLNTENNASDVFIQSPFYQFPGVSKNILKENSPNLVNDFCLSFFNETKEKIDKSFIVGPLSSDTSFINNLKVKTKLEFVIPDVFNKFFSKKEIPSFTKKEILRNAVSLGVSLTK